MIRHACPLCEELSFGPQNSGPLDCSHCGLLVDPRVWEQQYNAATQQECFGGRSMWSQKPHVGIAGLRLATTIALSAASEAKEWKPAGC
jgi:hypothetical protein